MGELRVAIVGAGDVARRDYLPEFHRLAGRARLELVCGRSPERAAQVAAEFGAARWSTDWRDALGADIDVVVNLTPAPVARRDQPRRSASRQAPLLGEAGRPGS